MAKAALSGGDHSSRGGGTLRAREGRAGSERACAPGPDPEQAPAPGQEGTSELCGQSPGAWPCGDVPGQLGHSGVSRREAGSEASGCGKAEGLSPEVAVGGSSRSAYPGS